MVKVPIIGTIVLLSACASHEIRYVPMQCPDIERPALPVVPEESMTCLSDDAYFDIQERDQLLRQYAERYESVCQTFQELANDAES